MSRSSMFSPAINTACQKRGSKEHPVTGAIVISLFLLSALIPLRALAANIVLLTNSEWPPYFSEGQKHYGIGSHIVTEAFALEGIEVEFRFFPPRRALELAKNGDFDGTVGWQLNEERKQFLIASDTIWKTDWVFFHLKSTQFDWNSFYDLGDLRIGGTVGYMYTPEFQQAERTGLFSLDRGPSDDQGMKKLMARRFDIFPQIKEIGYYQASRLFTPEQRALLTHHPKAFGHHKDQLLLSNKNKDSAQLMERFNRGLKKLRDSGKMQAFFDALERGEYNLPTDSSSPSGTLDATE
ncbi:transporter substrate-binding domain-containing protein [Aestuariirhabdus sp. Z084]|uniref:substrate-binding periplasmic protein n=1 Tax=Aestuariirhabdus haliotis TaxID=2918751 RepID=UPI00201B4521|nr:transporter substrate-binding domain-containing protein [Aestuariirhabdus haliotis]MCL6416838.1 transporter substrate-binding domain-containing protein [Aestuariirhabdus haliotis]MCL6420838.1 transporter substrate-binding domain-containing protein [Aestuariirhabdus haliotis]